MAIDKKVTEVSHVPKITPVKEGQQYPLGKNGQYKLFHEHVWPRGYTPDRLKQVSDLQFGVTASGWWPIHDNTKDNDRKINNNIASSIINDNIARSTIPIEDLRKIKRLNGEEGNPTEFWIGNNRPYPETNSYNPGSKKISIKTGRDDRPVDLQANLTHEIGHAVDDATNPERFFKDAHDLHTNTLDYAYGAEWAHPVLEGVAEGYSRAHSRITRDQSKWHRGKEPDWGYSASGWFFPDAQEQFKQARSKTFMEATGRPMEPVVEKSTKPSKASDDDQPMLPGIDPREGEAL